MDALWSNIALLVVILVTFYLAFIRPDKVAQKKRRQMLDNLLVGDRIVTVGGLYGEIVKLTKDTAIIKIAEGVDVTIVRSSVKYIVGNELERKGKKKSRR